MIVTFPFLKACLDGFFCFHALENTKQKKLTPLDRGPPLHVNKGLRSSIALLFVIIEDTANHEGLTKLLLFLSAVLFVA